MKFFAPAAFALAAFTAGQAMAAEGPYGQLSVYHTSVEDSDLTFNPPAGNIAVDNDASLGISAAIGYKLPANLRAEAELAYRDNNNSALGLDGNVKSFAGLANGYLDIPTGSVVTPYIGAGVGMAQVKQDDEKDTVLAYQAMAGLSFDVSPQTSFVLGYKYFATQTPEYDVLPGVTGEMDYNTHNIELGLRYQFDAPVK